MLQTHDQKVLYHQKKATLLLNSTCPIYNVDFVTQYEASCLQVFHHQKVLYNVGNSRMTAEDISLFFEDWYILKFLLDCCLANSIEARSSVASGDSVKKKEIFANFLAQFFFDFLRMPDARTFLVCLWSWCKIEVIAIFGSMITHKY